MTSLDIVIPATRRSVNRLLWSISQGTTLPDRVIVVTNEVENIEPFSRYYPVDVVGFSSREHPIGHSDQSLRRNIGFWEATGDVVITLDDDLFAPRGLVQSARAAIEGKGVVWGHHRYVDFEKHGDHLLDADPSAGRSREAYVNGYHGWQSCYAGLMVARRDILLEVGGYDMMFLGRGGNEDQNLGRRINHHLGLGDRVWVSEPPFAWHPDTPLCHGSPKQNTCGSSSWLEPVKINGVKFMKCSRAACSYRVFADDEVRLFTDDVVIPYDPGTVTLKKERI